MVSLNLTNKFSKNTLLNEENDIFIRKKTELSSGNYMLVQYNKSKLNSDDYNNFGLVKSVIFNTQNNSMISYSPPKSLTRNQFISNLTDVENKNSIIVEEFVEGTMINLFHCNNEWIISTRGSIGGNCKFYQGEDSLETFHQMFYKLCRNVNLDFELLPKDYCYSFVMQNKKNRIIKPIKEDKLYFITAYNIVNDDKDITVTNLYGNKEKFDYLQTIFKENTKVDFPKIHGEFNKNDEDDWKRYDEIFGSKNTNYDIMGVVFKNSENGEFTKIRNPNHKEIHDLKGNHCKIQYIYLDLRKSKTIDKYLKYYPDDRKLFLFFRNNLHKHTAQLYDNYISCYIKKTKPLKEWPYQYRTHMFNLHQKYLTELKEQDKYVTMPVVIQYFNDLHPSQQMFILNYSLRQKNIETKAVELQENEL